MTGASARITGPASVPAPSGRVLAGAPQLFVGPILLGLVLLVGCAAPETTGSPGGVEIKQQGGGSAFREPRRTSRSPP